MNKRLFVLVKHMAKRVNLKDIAAATNLDISTISRLLNGDPRARVTAARRENVLKVAKELGYIPNRTARSLRLQRTHSIGCVISDLENHVQRSRLCGLVDRMNEQDYMVSLLRYKQADIYVETVNRQSLEGVVWSGWGGKVGATPALPAVTVPSVIIDPFGLTGFETHSHSIVNADRAAGIHQAIAYLASCGHRRIAFVSAQTNVLRIAGYRSAVRELGLDSDPALESTFDYLTESADLVRMQGYSAIQKLLASKIPFTAVQAGNDVTAAGVVDALLEAGLQVPGDVAVIGYDNIEASSSPLFTKPFLTSIADPNYEMGVTAAQLLIDILENQSDPKEVIIPPALVLRSSA